MISSGTAGIDGDQPLHTVVMLLPDKPHCFAWQPGYEAAQVDEALGIVQHDAR